MKPGYLGLPSILTAIAVATMLPVTIGATTTGGISGNGTGKRWVFPNPFTQATTFELRVPNRARIKIDVYNIRGEHVRNLYGGDHGEEHAAGVYPIYWNGRDKLGEEVVPGVYICTLVADGNAVKSVKAIKF